MRIASAVPMTLYAVSRRSNEAGRSTWILTSL